MKNIKNTLFLSLTVFINNFAHVPLEDLWIEKSEESPTNYIICCHIKIDETTDQREKRYGVFELRIEEEKNLLCGLLAGFIIASNKYASPESKPFINKSKQLFRKDPIINAAEIMLYLFKAFPFYEPYIATIDTSKSDNNLNEVFLYYINTLQGFLSFLPIHRHFVKNIFSIQKEIDEAVPCITIPVIKNEIEKIKNQTSLDLVNMDPSLSFYIFQCLESLFNNHILAIEFLSQKEIDSCTSTVKLSNAHIHKVQEEMKEKKNDPSLLWLWQKHKTFYQKFTTDVYANFDEIIKSKNAAQFNGALVENSFIIDDTTKIFIEFTNVVSILKDQFAAQQKKADSDSSSLIGSFTKKITSLFSSNEEK